MDRFSDRSDDIPEGFQQSPFFLAPDEYGVIDGDTLWVDTRLEDGGELKFKIRLSAIDTPEMPVARMTDDFLASMGIDVHEANPGMMATRMLREAMAGMPILVSPAPQQGRPLDRHGRLLADVYFSGPSPLPEQLSPDTKGFDTDGYQNVSRYMFARGLAQLMPGMALPNPQHQVIELIRMQVSQDQLASGSFGY